MDVLNSDAVGNVVIIVTPQNFPEVIGILISALTAVRIHAQDAILVDTQQLHAHHLQIQAHAQIVLRNTIALELPYHRMKKNTHAPNAYQSPYKSAHRIPTEYVLQTMDTG